jgi:hypothetical protein
VLSGTSYGPPPQGLIDVLDEAVRKELLGDSAVWAGIFKDFNKPFGGPTGFEWLSRDDAEVLRYVSDPLNRAPHPPGVPWGLGASSGPKIWPTARSSHTIDLHLFRPVAVEGLSFPFVQPKCHTASVHSTWCHSDEYASTRHCHLSLFGHRGFDTPGYGVGGHQVGRNA